MGYIGSVLPEALGGRYNIYLWSQPLHVLAKAKEVLRSGRFRLGQNRDGLMVGLVGADITEVINTLSNSLSQVEKSALKILLFQGDEPAVEEYGSVVTFDHLLRALEGQWVVSLLKEGRYKSVVQPIVTAGEQTKVYAYEFLLRGLDEGGNIIAPIDIFKAAATHDLLPTLDHAARHSAVATAARLGITEKLFINFSPAAIFDPAICLKSTLEAIASHGFNPENVVFEIVESEVIADMPHLVKIVDYCRAHGLRMALDDFGAGFNNLGTYLDLKPDYIKIDKQLTARMVGDKHRREMVGGFIASAHRSGTKIIAEGIEDKATAEVLIALGVDYLQGYYYGYPAASQQPISLTDASAAQLQARN
jgi:EAL domain-containing protein (putative c-di-GMP-specific phosphodiesterase class I)